jgi:formamidopyrimidine-DNA glycosylase
VPELPEVERARATIERAALHRPITDVDDTDPWECRRDTLGEIRAALRGRESAAVRVRLDPDLSTLGPDAEKIGVAEFRHRVGRGTAPVKARLLDQSVLAGVGNLLVDEALWQARLDPQRRVDTLDARELTTLHRALRTATRAAIHHGGVPTGTVVPHRRIDGHCPRCGAPMERATVGGRTTWCCPREQM